ncbi:quercetin 2,3-dioxygenase [Bdellovibrio bacteriovorus]|uniref:Quercetin 2,3-dioxygenase n=1 Tax=Bdellovibrio bacteriovorus TaxID=959 RepID=A0A150WQ28_BDEBC|nr:pirin family protein [Bdellovibrio bacteriovorus]KYG66434.1 quercetin 2,3-dioxygenase [Bdellovibrio bacteriovorus]
MIQVRRANDRGNAQHGWLNSKHTFSFGEYYDRDFMGFSVLRVINEDRIQGGTGFDTHGHRDMEIISYVIEGALEHKDSMGSDVVIKPGEVQRMSAGTGVRHSEYNHLQDQATHFLQIWILPEVLGVKPSYDQKAFFQNDFSCSDMVLVGSRNGRNGSVSINQDVDMYAVKATDDGEKLLKTYLHRHIWIQVVKGDVKVENETLNSGDGAGITGVESLRITWTKGSEFLVFDLP